MFDLRRFRRLLAATWSENRRAWAWFFIVAAILQVLLSVVWLTTAGVRGFDLEAQAGLFGLGLFFGGALFAGRYYAGMASPKSALLLLMRPASGFEKWLLAIVVIVVVFPVAYTVAFTVVNLPLGGVSRALAYQQFVAGLFDDMTLQAFEAKHAVFDPGDFFDTPAAAPEVLAVLGTLQGFAFLGTLYFRSYPVIKTLVAGFVLWIVVELVGGITGGTAAYFFGYWQCDCGTFAPWTAILLPVAWFAVPGLVWAACLAALGEREVA